MINEETRAFIAAHASDDVRRLALNAKVAEGVDLRAALAPRDFLGVLPPVDFLAVCFVRAMTE